MAARRDLPGGIITCVFTDIEGSTRLLRELGPRYDDILERHNEVLRAIWGEHRGVEVKTLGDAFMVVFASARDAVGAAVGAERALQAVDWGTELPVRVRIGMHTGYAQPKDDDYTALVVHQAARVVSAARGGQVLLTAQTAAAVEADGCPEHVAMRSLGRFRVRDFDGPVALYAAREAGVEVDDAPPRVRPADGHNLVRPPTSLVGRGDDLAKVAQLVRAGRVTTIVGPGGVGKTRLATETALAVARSWADGAWFVDLGRIGDGELVGQAIGDAVGAPTTPGSERWRDVVAHLQQRRVLVILDNCEHLPETCAATAGELLLACPHVAVLATSRRPLGLRGECVHRLAPLARDGAVELFHDRSAGGVPAGEDVVAELCRELDGLPLAIELAAARATAVPPAEILRRLRRAPADLRSRDPGLPERQRSLGRLLDWSWELLTPAARTVLGRLSVFAGSFDMTAAEHVGAAPADDPDEIAELVWTLIDASLVRLEETEGATRYRLLATVRAHAAARADAVDRVCATRRLAQVLLERVGPDHAIREAWVAEMALELANVRAAVAQVDDAAAAQALGWSIGRYHEDIDVFPDAVAELRRVLDARPEPGPERVGLLTMRADLQLRLGDVERAELTLDEAAALERDVGGPGWDEEAVARTRGEIAVRRDDAPAAIAEALAGLERAFSPRSRARLLSLLGCARSIAGDFDGAVEAVSGEIEAATAAGADTFLVTSHNNLAEMHLRRGDERAAAHHQGISLSLARERRKPVLVAFSLMIAARLVAARGRAHSAVALQTKADDLLAAADYALYEDDVRMRAVVLDEAARHLTADGFNAAVAAGHALGDDAAADLAEDVFSWISESSDISTRRPVA